MEPEDQVSLGVLFEQLAQLHVAAARHLTDLRALRTEISTLEAQIAARQTPLNDWE